MCVRVVYSFLYTAQHFIYLWMFQTVKDHQALSFSQIVKQWRRSNVGQDSSVNRTILLKYYPKKVQGGLYTVWQSIAYYDILYCYTTMYVYIGGRVCAYNNGTHVYRDQSKEALWNAWKQRWSITVPCEALRVLPFKVVSPNSYYRNYVWEFQFGAL